MGAATLPVQSESQHVDVLIVGAGISGIGSAYHLQQNCPDKSYAIVEMKDTFGGTWETHKYPGVRSDSDLYTFGYRFKPWVGPPIATADKILAYMQEVIDENAIDQHILYGHRITACQWSSESNRWTVAITRLSDDAELIFTTGFLWMCQGYYDHEDPYLPDWEGMDDYQGLLIHAQLWDPSIDYAGKKVLVIGSGATAATAVPEFAKTAEHVTMLQRSPTYFYCDENRNELADRLRTIGIDDETIHRVVRADLIYHQYELTKASEQHPDMLFEHLKEQIRKYAGDDFEFAPHFTPRYRPWQQRLAFCPGGDIFKAVADGKVTVVTDTIDRFTANGVRTASGEELEADIIVAATGFKLSMMGGIPFTVDGREIDWHQCVSYRGMMFTGVPNLVWVMGYFRASWTLRVDMLGDLVCRLLQHMDVTGARKVEVALRDNDHDMPLQPWISEDEFNPNYLLRGLHLLPQRGDKPEWRHNQDYWVERDEMPATDFNAPEFVYDQRSEASAA